LHHEAVDGEPWPYVRLADAIEDAQRYLAAHDGGELAVHDGRVTTIHVQACRGPR
jgi:hypothetical protein